MRYELDTMWIVEVVRGIPDAHDDRFCAEEEFVCYALAYQMTGWGFGHYRNALDGTYYDSEWVHIKPNMLFCKPVCPISNLLLGTKKIPKKLSGKKLLEILNTYIKTKGRK